MRKLIRFSVSLEKELSDKFNSHIKTKNHKNRSEAIRGLIREELIKTEWLEGKEIAGAVTLVYDHHKRELVNRLTEVQHDFHELIISTQHVHMDHSNCLEIVVVKGKPKLVEELANKLKSIKGVKFGTLAAATTGKNIA